MRNGSGESGELPPGWVWTSIDDFSDHCLGKMLDGGKKRLGDPLPYLRNINVRWGAFDLEELYEMPFEAAELRRYGIVDGDVLVCEGGEPGRCAVWRAGPTEIKIQKALHRVRCCDGISPEFIALQLRYLAINDRLSSHFTGTTIKHLPGVALKQVRFRLAPANEQRRIVAKIEELFGEIEAGEQELEKAREGLAAYRRAALKAAVTGELTREWREKNAPKETGADLLDRILANRCAEWERVEFAELKARGQSPKGEGWKARHVEPTVAQATNLPNLPRGWTWASLTQLGEFGRGRSRHRPRDDAKLYGGPYPFIQTGDVRRSQGQIVEYRQTYTEQGLAQSKLWPAGTVCITIAANIAASGILTFDACFPDSVVGLVPQVPIIGQYVEFFIRTARDHLDRFAPATAQKNINLETLESLCVPLPPLAELVEIVRQVTAQLDATADADKEAGLNLGISSRLRQSILAAAFSGRLVPQDPADEPASALLDPLRASRAPPAANARRRVRGDSGIAVT